MAQVIWTESALTDLDEIAEYIALDKEDAARHLVKKVSDNIGQLELFPEMGRKPPELKDFTYREIVVNPCRIFYRLEQNKVYILHVMRGERQLRNYLLDERTYGGS